METNKKYYIGSIVLVLLIAGAFVATYDNKAKIKITDDYSKFYNLIDGRWRISGTEYNKLFDGTKQVYRYASQVEVWNETEGQTFKIYRHTPFRRVHCNITDEYLFDGDISNVERFPMHHKLTFEGCKDLFYRYQIEDLKYDGLTNYNIVSPASFGHDMKVTWDDGYNWAHIYQNGKLKVQWKIPEDYYELNVRLFDPPTYNSTNITLNYNISEPILFHPNISMFNISSMRQNETNITAINQTATNFMFYFHNNGTSNYTIMMALNDTAPNNHTFKCGLYPTNLVPINIIRRNLNSSANPALLLAGETRYIWCYLDLIEANATALRKFNITGSYE